MNYHILELIGEGSFGKVFRGQCKETGKIFAMKFIPKRNKDERELKSLRRECEIQKELSHPHIVQMIDAFETEAELVTVSEYVPVQLCSLLIKHGKLSEEKVRKIACNLISAIYYLHSLRILHRDIKPQNILLNEKDEAKLCDFGFSRKMGLNTYVLTSVKGTPLYMAPELIDESPYDHTADLWSLGCILFELLTGKPPFSTTSIVQLIKMVHRDPIVLPLEYSLECKSFLNGLLQKEPSQRWRWPDLLKHPWVKNGIVYLEESFIDSHLINPLSTSQEHLKEIQKQNLVKKGLFMPKVFKNLTVPKYGDNSTSNYINSVTITDVQLHADIGHDQLQCDSGKHCKNNLTTQSHFEDLVKDPKNFGMIEVSNNDSGSENLNKINFDSRSIESFSNENLIDYGHSEIYSNILTASLNRKLEKNLNSSYKETEIEEWVIFLDKTLYDVLVKENFSLFCQNGEVNMYISALQKENCSVILLDKIITLFLIPFLYPGDINFKKVLKVFVECKLLPNLLYSLNFICLKTSKNDTFEMNKAEVETIFYLISLTCHLIHSDEEFITQFCDTVCIFSMYKCLGNFITSDIHAGLTEKLLAILNALLDYSHENRSIMCQIFPQNQNVYSLFNELFHHRSTKTCISACYLIGHSIKASCAYFKDLKEQHEFVSDLINLETNSNSNVVKAASFAVINYLKSSEVDVEEQFDE